jgi:hypothetical protein
MYYSIPVDILYVERKETSYNKTQSLSVLEVDDSNAGTPAALSPHFNTERQTLFTRNWRWTKSSSSLRLSLLFLLLLRLVLTSI